MSPSKVAPFCFDTFYNVVDGKTRTAKTAHRGINPMTLEELWPVPVATQQDVDDAVAAGMRAFPAWRDTPIEKRKELLGKFAELFSAYADDFLSLLCQETGKPRPFAAMETNGVQKLIQAHQDFELPVEKIEDDEKVITTTYTPLGVVGAICPWNFPITLSMGKVVPALLTGNVVIVKPSPFTPYTALKYIELAQQIFPRGVVQALGGDDRLGPMFTAHPDIAKISFTGSIATGKKVMEASAKTLKRVTLELGGNDACIVFPDVDVAKVAPEVAMGAFFNSGQVCVATKRIYIHEKIYKDFVAAMVEFAKKLKVGASDEEGVMLGPVQNAMQYERVKGFFADSKEKNHTFAHGEPDVAGSKGYFIQPTIIDNPPHDSRIIQEEPFGPIVPTQPWSDLDEIIQRANNTKAGLGASVWAKDVAQAEACAKRLEAGNVFVNSYVKPNPKAFFSGHKESGIGGEYGTKGLLSYCNAHVMHSYKL
ncbi:aldehyde dehydrogenase domain-containing protein [Lineolata rhizophorae]|uniref:aldehyde dehydrogenase (NAD(+)) n=1 Tax=Lineolata rhizophorae TaxID=578093 RepID=A0A6A6P3E1_9PEZI|nr:aldehyde dehydrogenase domain-containing protein [Lineolata rhizophorae]